MLARKSLDSLESLDQGRAAPITMGQRLFNWFNPVSQSYEDMPTLSGHWQFLIHPRSPFGSRWSVVMMFWVIACAVTVPFQLAFDYEPDFSRGGWESLWLFMLKLMDIFFIADIVVNFYLAYERDGELVTYRPRIRCNYICTWFTIDFVAGFSGVAGFVTTANSSDTFDGLRLMRLARLLKLVHLVDVGNMFESFDRMFPHMRAVTKMLKIFLLIVGSTHILSCFFCMVSTEWMDQYYTDRMPIDVKDASIAQRYMISMYWGFITMTTVGYGDVVPVTDNERIYCMVISLVGSSIFAYFVGEMTAYATERHASETAFHQKLKSIEEFMIFYTFPTGVKDRIRSFYEQSYRTHGFFKTNEIINELPFDTKAEVTFLLKKHAIKKVAFFRNATDKMIGTIVCRLVPKLVAQGEVVVHVGDVGNAMFFIQHGEVEVEIDEHTGFLMGDGGYFGEIALINKRTRRTATIRCTKPSELLELSRENFDTVLSLHPEFLVYLKDNAMKRLRRGKVATNAALILEGVQQHESKNAAADAAFIAQLASTAASAVTTTLRKSIKLLPDPTESAKTAGGTSLAKRSPSPKISTATNTARATVRFQTATRGPNRALRLRPALAPEEEYKSMHRQTMRNLRVVKRRLKQRFSQAVIEEDDEPSEPGTQVRRQRLSLRKPNDVHPAAHTTTDDSAAKGGYLEMSPDLRRKISSAAFTRRRESQKAREPTAGASQKQKLQPIDTSVANGNGAGGVLNVDQVRQDLRRLEEKVDGKLEAISSMLMKQKAVLLLLSERRM